MLIFLLAMVVTFNFLNYNLERKRFWGNRVKSEISRIIRENMRII